MCRSSRRSAGRAEPMRTGRASSSRWRPTTASWAWARRLGGTVTKALIDTEIAPMFLGENPFDIERMLSKATFVPLYYGKCGYCAIAGLELACWDLMGKATGLPVCRLIGGRLRDEIPFAAYVYHRNANRRGEGRVDTLEDVVARAEELVQRTASRPSSTRAGSRRRRRRSRSCGRCEPASRKAKLRYDPQAIYSPATAIRIGKAIEPLDLEYYEDPCWGNVAMARVRERVSDSARHQYVRDRPRQRGRRARAGLGRRDPRRHFRVGRYHRDARSSRASARRFRSTSTTTARASSASPPPPIYTSRPRRPPCRMRLIPMPWSLPGM